MKTSICLVFSLTAAATVQAQGTVTFANNSASAVSNTLTMTRVAAGTTFSAALYYAPDGVADEALFQRIATTNFFQPGVFYGGTRTTPPTTPPGEWAMFQVRVFETAYGSSYEQVLSCPSLVGGRCGLVGKSIVVRVKTGNPQALPPTTPGSLVGTNGLRGFCVGDSFMDWGRLSVLDATVVEGNDGVTNLLFLVTLDGYPSTDVTVGFNTFAGTATAGADYLTTNGTLTFPWIPVPPVGPRTQVLAVPVVGDTDIEPDETLSLVLTNAQNGYLLRGTATGTIRNDDCRTSVAFAWYPGVTIEGCIGKTYRIEVAEAAPGPYTAITNLVLPSSPYLWLDNISTLGPERYYRTFLVPAP
jgi:hypothetical protein